VVGQDQRTLVELQDEYDEENDCAEEIREKAGKAKTVEVIEHSSTGNREAAILYLTDLTIRKTVASNSDLLRFYAKVKTSHSKTHSAYTLMDPRASHCDIDSKYAKQLGLPLRRAGRMSVVTTATKHPTMDRYQVWLDGSIWGISGNYTTITSWYTLFDLGGVYDLIV
jgi:hypothetical protein